MSEGHTVGCSLEAASSGFLSHTFHLGDPSVPVASELVETLVLLAIHCVIFKYVPALSWSQSLLSHLPSKGLDMIGSRTEVPSDCLICYWSCPAEATL